MRNGAIVLVLAAALAAGCGKAQRGPLPPALPMEEVLKAHDAWAESVQHLWSRSSMTLNLPQTDKPGQRSQYSLDGHLLLAKPGNLFLNGDVLGHELFRLGMNPERFWLWVEPRVRTQWTGRRGGPGERRFILAAADLMTALGLDSLHLDPKDLTTFSTEPEQYVLTEETLFAGRRVPWRRTWFDRWNLRPVRVDLYNESGKRILMSELLEYEKDGETDVCAAYRVRFYGDDTVTMVLRLSDVSVTRSVPMVNFKYRVPDGARVVDLDAAPSPDPAGGPAAK
jgi:hypothetical protein